MSSNLHPQRPVVKFPEQSAAQPRDDSLAGETTRGDKALQSEGKYRTIVADPPWHYEAFATAPAGTDMRHSDPLPYPSMSEEEIMALGPLVRSRIASGGAFLFLWTTNRYLPAAFDVVASWGFRYRQTITWHKTGSPSPFGGTVAPPHSEFLLVARRGGNVKMIGERFPSSVIAAQRQRAHSQKPELFLDLIERVAPGPYLEMFSRRARLGWDTWGNESLHGMEAVA